MRGIVSLLGRPEEGIEVLEQPALDNLDKYVIVHIHQDPRSSCDISMTLTQALELRDKLCALLGDPIR
jgi:hypothetical protein